MLTMPPYGSRVASIVGIDPGSTTLGVAIIRFDCYTYQIVSTRAFTVKAAKLSKESWATEVHGERLGRINAIEEKLYWIFRDVEPFQVVSESPFYSFKHPNAYGVLMEVITAIRNALMRYDLWKELHLIDPPSVKNAVGAKGNAGKDEVRAKVLGLAPTLRFVGPVPMEELDEHSFDSIGVAYGRYQRMLEELCLSTPKL